MSFLRPRHFESLTRDKSWRASVVLAILVASAVTLVVGATSASAADAGRTPKASTSTKSTDDLLSRLITVEVEPGVLRVVSDGIRDLRRTVDREDALSAIRAIRSSHIAAGPDGSVWMFGPDGFFSLGEERTYAAPPSVGDIEVAPDGTLWRLDDRTLTSFDGESWTVRFGPGDRARNYKRRDWRAPKNAGVSAFDIGTDGTVWATVRAQRAKWYYLITFDGKGWTGYGPPPLLTPEEVSAEPSALAVNSMVHEAWWKGKQPDAVEVWVRAQGSLGLSLMSGDRSGEGVDDAFYAIPGHTGPFDVGRDGTMWAYLDVVLTVRDRAPYLARFDGDWTVYSADEGVPVMVGLPSLTPPEGFGGAIIEALYSFTEGFVKVAPDGSVWMTPKADLESTGTACDGLARFDGSMWTRYLPGICIYAFDIAPDGTAWSQGGELDIRAAGFFPGPIDTYLITPEAVAATE